MYSISEDYNRKLWKCKLVFLGEQSVGKTSLVTKFMYDSFVTTYQSTIGVDFLSKTMYLNEKILRFQLWDTAGQERFSSLMPAYIRDSSIAVIVYDVTNSLSFSEIDKWINHVRNERGNNVIIILVGNKIDLTGLRVISSEDGQKKAMQLNVMFIETSAKNGLNVKLLFKRLAERLLKSETVFEDVNEDTTKIVLKESNNFNSSNKACIC